MWTTQIRLSTEMETSQDSAGFETETPSWSESIPASRADAGRQDQTLADQEGYTASAVYTIESAAYDSGTSVLIDDASGEIYDIRRTYQPQKSHYIQLTCEVRESGKH